MKRNFNAWICGFKGSISDYSYYVDFRKVFDNVEKLKVELNILNSLIGSKNIEDDFERIIERYPETLKCIPLLLAVRQNEIYTIDQDGEFNYSFKHTNYPIDQYKVFMRKTGLFDLIENHVIANLIDYVTGVEVGLDSNGRKNRGGHLMKELVESFILKSGLERNVTYFKNMYIHDIQDRWGMDLSELAIGVKAKKRFDFVVKTKSNIIGIETNFYSSSGSKLNETARGYKALAIRASAIEGFKFVWITDGLGWVGAKHNLEEMFEITDNIYSINDLENGAITQMIEE